MATETRFRPHVLVVGSSGALQCALAERLLHAGSSVRVILEPNDLDAAKGLRQSDEKRLTVLSGDPSHVDFGLSRSEYGRLAEEVTAIVDLAPLGFGPADGEPHPGTLPARETLELATVGAHRPRVIALSSIAVARGSKGIFAENDTGAAGRVPTPFTSYLTHRERILRRFSNRIPVDIIRTGCVVGPRPGLCPLVALLFATDSEQLASVGPLSFPLASLGSLFDLLEHRVGLRDESDSRTFHLFETPLVAVDVLRRRVSQLASHFAPRAFELRKGAQRLFDSRSIGSWMPGEFWKTFPREVRYSGRATERYLEEHGLLLPRIDDRMMRQLVSEAVEEMVGFR